MPPTLSRDTRLIEAGAPWEERTSSGATSVDIAELVADAKLGKQCIAILLLSALMLLIDGFDMSTAGVAAPSLLKAFHGERAAMGTIFGARYAGILGCWVFGYVGDRWGRP